MGMNPSATFTRADAGIQLSEMDLVMNRTGYVAHRVMPIVTRSKPTGQYPEIPIEQLMARRKVQRSPEGNYQRSSSVFTNRTYSTSEKAHESLLDQRTQKAYDDYLDMRQWEGERVTNVVLQEHEIEVADYLFNTTTFSGKTAAVGTAWSTSASCTPIADVDTAREAIFVASGYEPNAIVVNRKMFRHLQNAAQIVDRVKYQGFQNATRAEMTEQAIAAALDLDYVIVAGGAKNSANPIKAASLARIWANNYALVCRVAVTNNPSEACLGRTIVWDQESEVDGDRLAVILESYMDDAARCEVIRARADWGVHAMYLEHGYLLTGVGS